LLPSSSTTFNTAPDDVGDQGRIAVVASFRTLDIDASQFSGCVNRGHRILEEHILIYFSLLFELLFIRKQFDQEQLALYPQECLALLPCFDFEVSLQTVQSLPVLVLMTFPTT
jgi:hypothetical protein